MNKRRQFIKTSSYLALGSIVLPMACSPKKKTTEEVAEEATAPSTTSTSTLRKGIGVQAYSVREALQEDFAGSMKKIAEMGYKYIEAYGMSTDGQLFGMAPSEYKKIVDDLGMEVVSCHSTYFTPEEAPAMIEASQGVGIKYHIIPWMGEDQRKDYHAVAENLNKVGELFKGTGIKFGYHNHDFEIIEQNGEVPLEIMLKETDPELVTFEADLYWVVKGGMDPMELINKYPGRFSLYHVKDANQELDQTTVGSGIIDFKSLLGAHEEAGLDYYFVEDERTEDPFGNLKGAIEYLKNLEI